jgi:hypothetical protein
VEEWILCGAALLLLATPSSAQTQKDESQTPLEKPEASLRAIGRQINNPISSLSSITFDNSITSLDGGGLDDDLAYAGTLQPLIPIQLEKFGLERVSWARDLMLITRLTIPFFETVPLEPGSRDDRKAGFGDIQLAGVIAPSRTNGWLWGIGPTLIVPSASADAIGGGKWQAGPAVTAGYLGSEWTAYVVAQQWWSFAGDDNRSRTRQLSLEYVLLRNFPNEWLVGMQPSMEVDWTESGNSKVLFPIGAGIGKTVRIGNLPVQIWVEADYYAVRPDNLSAPRWGIDIQIIPVIGELF